MLTRLTLAWSRDGKEKIYVQHRMREVGRDLWSWLDDGAHIYVCGDALAHGQGRRGPNPNSDAHFLAVLRSFWLTLDG